MTTHDLEVISGVWTVVGLKAGVCEMWLYREVSLSQCKPL